MTITAQFAIPELAMLRPAQFQARPACPKCGSQTPRRPLWLCRLTTAEYVVIKMIYCGGGKPLTEAVQTPFGVQEGQYLCAGVSEEHHHRICGRCGAHWITQIQAPPPERIFTLADWFGLAVWFAWGVGLGVGGYLLGRGWH